MSAGDDREQGARGEGSGEHRGSREDEFSRRTEEFRQAAADMSRELRRLVSDFQGQVMVFAEDLRGRGREGQGFSQSPVEKIRALAELRDEGIITEAEFEEQKRRLLDQV